MVKDKIHIKLILLLGIFSIGCLNGFSTVISEKYCSFFRTTKLYNKNTPDSFYKIVDTVFQFEFREGGVFIRTDKTYTKIYKPGKKDKKWHKTFKVINGRYKRQGDILVIVSGFKASGNSLSRYYERQEVVNWDYSFIYLWDLDKQFNYQNDLNWDSYESCLRMFRKRMNLIHENSTTHASDSISFWQLDSNSFDFNELPMPKFLYPGVHLYSHTFLFLML